MQVRITARQFVTLERVCDIPPEEVEEIYLASLEEVEAEDIGLHYSDVVDGRRIDSSDITIAVMVNGRWQEYCNNDPISQTEENR